jgi:hypothetical protein
MVGAPEPRSKNRRRGDHMDEAGERAKAAMAAKKDYNRRSKGKRARGRGPKAGADEPAPAREVLVRGTAISLPGLRFLDE